MSGWHKDELQKREGKPGRPEPEPVPMQHRKLWGSGVDHQLACECRNQKRKGNSHSLSSSPESCSFVPQLCQVVTGQPPRFRGNLGIAASAVEQTIIAMLQEPNILEAGTCNLLLHMWLLY